MVGGPQERTVEGPANCCSMACMPSELTTTRTIWLVRHGMRQDFEQADWFDTAKRPHDPPLSDNGRIQAHETGKFLRDKGVERIYSSPFLRTVETAAIIAEHCQAPVCIEHGLGEVQKAEWFPRAPDFLPAPVLKEHFSPIDPSYDARVRPKFPECEEAGELDERCRETVEALMTDDWACTLWVGHGASVGGAVKALIGHTEGVCFQMCGLTGLRGAPGGWDLLYSGTDHLSITEETVRFV
jgi:broad specificity phosphatase PhoE